MPQIEVIQGKVGLTPVFPRYLDEGLMKKLESKWEEPTEDEVDIIHKVDRTKSMKK